MPPVSAAMFEDAAGQLADLPMVGQVRGRKLMICVENVADKATSALLPDELERGQADLGRLPRRWG